MTLRLQRELDLGAGCESGALAVGESAFGSLREPLEDLAVAEVFGPAGCGGVESAVAGFRVDTVRQGELYEGRAIVFDGQVKQVAGDRRLVGEKRQGEWSLAPG